MNTVTAEENATRIAFSPNATNGAAAVTGGANGPRGDFSPTATEWREYKERLTRFHEDCRRRNRLHDLAELNGSVCEECEVEIGPAAPLWRIWSRVPTAPYRGRWCLVTHCEPCGRELRERFGRRIDLPNGRILYIGDRRYWLETECEECERQLVFGVVGRRRRLFCCRRCANRLRVRPHNARRAERRAAAREGLTCAVCDTTFNPSRSDARYCSAACRQRAYRRRKVGV